MRSSYCKAGLVAECPIHLKTDSGKKFRCDNPAHGDPRQPKKRRDEEDERDDQ